MNTQPILAAVTAAALLSGCVVATPYQPSADGQGAGFGYKSAKVEDSLYRVSFVGNGRTPRRAVDAYALFRAAEIAKEARAPAFAVLEGRVDRTVLEGNDTFAKTDGTPLDGEDFNVARHDDGAGPADAVVDAPSVPTIRTAGVAAPIVFSRPMPLPPQPVARSSYTPIFIYTASGPVVFPQGSLLVRLLTELPTEEDPKVFVTEDVLTRLGPRIVRKPS
ncbi:hypothetical protein BH10PSE18_BH10PSE18_21900 [soil metagenome]